MKKLDTQVSNLNFFAVILKGCFLRSEFVKQLVQLLETLYF